MGLLCASNSQETLSYSPPDASAEQDQVCLCVGRGVYLSSTLTRCLLHVAQWRMAYPVFRTVTWPTRSDRTTRSHVFFCVGYLLPSYQCGKGVNVYDAHNQRPGQTSAAPLYHGE